MKEQSIWVCRWGGVIMDVVDIVVQAKRPYFCEGGFVEANCRVTIYWKRARQFGFNLKKGEVKRYRIPQLEEVTT
jgi:hypothetical protein